ncbi:hypothetical protein RHMOL_Rhmol06G0096200 [Rhododendron molle]|uniref:Uncharacterized protein n=1 Tax=Rhododendron molle TaxID=49168 RepID=A0ACC0NAS8_RHOML|nr:hypothetical protein RHMOL_Rhmol06G0096200 [Rhododendron molle]
MDLSQEIDDYIKESIEYALGLPVSTQTLESKLNASEAACNRLRQQCLYLQTRLKEKDDVIDRSRAESCMNAQALKKFVEENQKLAKECESLLGQCRRWENECSLYDHDREALMDFGNEADERAKEAEVRVHELEGELRRVVDELQFYKHQCEMQSSGGQTGVSTAVAMMAASMVDSSREGSAVEQLLLESLITTMVGNDEVTSTAHAFLQANSGVDVCQKLLNTWNSLRPSTRKILALAAEVKTLENDKEHLRFNLARAEEEVKVLFEENEVLHKENKRLLRHQKERCHPGSSEKRTGSASAKGNKRKTSPLTSSPIEGKINFGDGDSPRKPLSPLLHNSPESRMHKK